MLCKLFPLSFTIIIISRQLLNCFIGYPTHLSPLCKLTCLSLQRALQFTCNVFWHTVPLIHIFCSWKVFNGMCACLPHDLTKKSWSTVFCFNGTTMLSLCKKFLQNCQIHHKFTNKLHRNSNLSEASSTQSLKSEIFHSKFQVVISPTLLCVNIAHCFGKQYAYVNDVRLKHFLVFWVDEQKANKSCLISLFQEKCFRRWLQCTYYSFVRTSLVSMTVIWMWGYKKQVDYAYLIV